MVADSSKGKNAKWVQIAPESSDGATEYINLTTNEKVSINGNLLSSYYGPLVGETTESPEKTLDFISSQEYYTSTAQYPVYYHDFGQLLPIFGYNQKGQRDYSKLVAIVGIVPQNTSDSILLATQLVDPNYQGKLDGVWAYPVGGSSDGSFGYVYLPLVNENTTGQVQFIDVTDPNNPVTLNTDQLKGQVGEAMDLSNAQQQLNHYLSADGKYVLADGNADVDGQSNIISRNFSNQVDKNNIVIRLTHIKPFLSHSNMLAIHGHLIVDGKEDPDFKEIANDLGGGEYGTTYNVNLETQKVVSYATDLTSEINTILANVHGINAHASFDEKSGILTVTYDPTSYVQSSGKYSNYGWANNPAKQTLTIDFSKTVPYVHIGTGFSDSTIPDIPVGVGVVQLNGQNLEFKGVNIDPGIELYWYLDQNIQKADLKIVDQDAAGYNVTNPYDSPAIDIPEITTTFNASGKPASQINFDNGTSTVQSAIDALVKKGYELVSNNFGNDASFDNDNDVDQHFVVVMKHKHQDVTPDQDENTLVKQINRLIDYKDTEGNEVKGSPNDTASYAQHVYFVRTAVKDMVTGDTLGYDLNGDAQVDVPAEFGNQAWQAAVKGTDGKYTVTADANQFDAVNSKTPQSLGYDIVNLPTVEGHAVGWDSPAEVVHVIYSKTPEPIKEQGSIKVVYFDDTAQQSLTKIGNTSLGYDSGKQDSGTAVAFTDHDAQIKALTDNGYKIVSDPTSDMPNQIGNNDLTYTIHVAHVIVPVTPDKPGNGLDHDALTKTVTETVHYQYADKTQALPDKTADLHFTGTAYYDAVTKKWTDAEGNELQNQDLNITWTANDGHDFAVVVSPKIDGYHITSVQDKNNNSYDDGNGNVKGITEINQNSKNIDVTVTYTKDPVSPEVVQGQVTYIDDTANQTLAMDTFNGKVGDKIVYTTGDKIKAYEDQGYELVSNDFKDGNETFAQSGNSFTVHLKHGTRPVTPDNPDPDHGYTKESLTKQGTQTVTYVGAGDQTPAPNVTNIEFEHTLVIDKVTGKVITDNGWTPTSQTYKVIDTPEVAGYTPDQQSAGGETVQIDPKTGNGDINKNYVVTYTKNPASVNDQTAIVNYVDADENNALITSSGDLTGKPGTQIDYSTAKTIKDLEGEGYVLVNDGFPAGATFDHDDSTTQTYTVVLKHAVIPVTPDKPGNGLKDTDLMKTVTETVHYVGAGDQTPADKTTQLHFTGTAYYDSVTKKWTDSEGHELTDQSKNITWTAEDGHKFAVVVTPAIDGYTSTVQDGYDDGNGNVKEISGIDQNSDDVNVTVTYNKTSEPTTPTNPNKPTEPETPTNPNKPTEPTEPKTPVNPDVPTNPEGPVGPMTPNNPGTSMNPEIPNSPETPANPGTRTSLNTPVQPVANNINHVVSAQQQAPAAKNNSTLPQTGNEEVVSAAALGLMGLAVAASLGAGATKKRHE